MALGAAGALGPPHHRSGPRAEDREGESDRRIISKEPAADHARNETSSPRDGGGSVTDGTWMPARSETDSVCTLGKLGRTPSQAPVGESGSSTPAATEAPVSRYSRNRFDSVPNSRSVHEKKPA